MANFNKVILIGNLTRDPQLSYLPSQTAVVEFGLAVNRRWRSQDGQQREDTCFIDCRAFGRSAETINQYTTKGRQLLVEGRLDYDTWETPDGQKRSKHRVTVENFQFLDSGQGGQGGGQGGQRAPAQAGRGPAQGRPQQQRPSVQDDDFAPPPEEPGGEDIPF